MNPTVERVTQKIIARSKESRARYLAKIDAAKGTTVHRAQLSCGNLAHGFAACSPDDKASLKSMVKSNIGIVTSYNDMLSAHQPYEHYPDIIKRALHQVGAVGQVAGGVPAMCDGVTQGQDGMELSLLSRDLIAMSAAVGLSHNMFDGALFLGVCDKIVMGCLLLRWPSATCPLFLCPRGRCALGFPIRKKCAFASCMPRAKLGATRCWNPKPTLITAPAPARFTAPLTQTKW